MKTVYMTIIPGSRISKRIRPEVRIYSPCAALLVINISKGGENVKSLSYNLEQSNSIKIINPDFNNITGDILLKFNFFNAEGQLIGSKEINYQVFDSTCNSSTLIDGCWIDLYHWSENEARWYNNDLKKLTDLDWKEQITAAKHLGINDIIITNVFHCNEYAGKHNMSVKNYKGQALYPSTIFKERFPITAENPVEAILSEADKSGMNIFIGGGNFAWFDYSPQSLEWYVEVTRELYELYGHHHSLYGWYVSGEIFGNLYYEWEPVPDEKNVEIAAFFKEYRDFIQQLAPTMPVALAPSNIEFNRYEKEWKEILENVDILLPFGFARDFENSNMHEVQRICNECNTHMWMDMEMFEWPVNNGLIPKTCDELVKEIRAYDDVEQIYGYAFTGMMNTPESRFNLGGEKAKQLYRDYYEYYCKVRDEML